MKTQIHNGIEMSAWEAARRSDIETEICDGCGISVDAVYLMLDTDGESMWQMCGTCRERVRC